MEFDIRLGLLQNPGDLERQWRDLEMRCKPSFFQTWRWIGCWLRHNEVRPLVLEARQSDRVVALGLFSESRIRKRGRVPARCLYLHEAGDKRRDCLTIEYNGILADQTVSPDVIQACIDFLMGDNVQVPPWEELYFSGVDSVYASFFANYSNINLMETMNRCFAVDFDEIRRKRQTYLESLSRNTRHQVRRAERLYERDGDIRLTPARDMEKALQFFNEMKPLHVRYWASKGSESAFNNAIFMAFHEALIRESTATGGTEILRITAGCHVIGYLYNFKYAGRVYFYMSAFNYQTDAKLKPGLLSHALAAQYYMDQQMATYDFMAGDARYKASLSNVRCEMHWLVVQRKRWKFAMEERLREVKRSAKSVARIGGRVK